MLIIASAGINKVSEERIRKMILAGADGIRFNLTYYDIDETIKYIELIKKIKDQLNSTIKILIDFPLNKIQFGEFEDGAMVVKEGDCHIFKSAPFSPDCNEFIPINTTYLGEKVKFNQTISLANGRITVQVTKILNRESIEVLILNNGIIKPKQTFNNDTAVSEQDMLEKYSSIMKKIADLRPDYIAISYLNKNFAKKTKEIPEMTEIQKYSKINIKIENELDDDALEQIFTDKFYHRVLLDRGELAVNIPYEKTGIYQKKICNLCKKYNKSLFISTQILNSTLDNYIPAKSDILDLTNMVLDGVRGIILTKETSQNRRPAYAISVAKKIIEAVEKTNATQ